MRQKIALGAAIIDFLANIPYIIDALKGKSKPNIATWSTWTLINGISAAAAYQAHAYSAAILAFSNLFGAGLVLLIGLRRGTRKYTLFDAVCQTIAILGLILWQV